MRSTSSPPLVRWLEIVVVRGQVSFTFKTTRSRDLQANRNGSRAITVRVAAWTASAAMRRTQSGHGGEWIDGVSGGQDSLTVRERVTQLVCRFTCPTEHCVELGDTISRVVGEW